MMKTRMILMTGLVAMISCATRLALAQTSTPNIVFILTDNLGYGEVGAYGGGVTRGGPTPRIDSLAREGMRFLNFNMETQRTPSRSSLMTGRWAIRSGTHSVPFGGVADGLTQWEVTIGRHSPRRVTRPAIKASGISEVMMDDCPMTRVSMNGLASRARRTSHFGHRLRDGRRTSCPPSR